MSSILLADINNCTSCLLYTEAHIPVCSIAAILSSIRIWYFHSLGKKNLPNWLKKGVLS